MNWLAPELCHSVTWFARVLHSSNETHRALKHTGFPISSKYVGTKVAAVTPPTSGYLPSINMNLQSHPGTELERY